MPDQPILPPAQLLWLVDLVGEPAALAVVEAYAGTRQYVPRNAALGINAVVAAITEKGAAALAAEYAGNYVRIPSCKAWRAQIYRARGETHPQIARRLGLDVVSVGRILQQAGMTVADPSKAQKRRAAALQIRQLSLRFD
jgi:orotidine-5'-phosphate decarboxylase